MDLLAYLEVLEDLEPKVCQDPLVWMDLMALVDLKDSLEPQVGVEEVPQVPLVFLGRREREVSPTVEVLASPERREREETKVLLDPQGSLVGPDLLVRLWAQTFPDLWETQAFLVWMESMVSVVLQVLQGHLVQAQPRETEVTMGSQASQDPPAGKEIQESLEAPDSPAALVSKESKVTVVTAEELVSKVCLVTLATMDSKDPRD